VGVDDGAAAAARTRQLLPGGEDRTQASARGKGAFVATTRPSRGRSIRWWGCAEMLMIAPFRRSTRERTYVRAAASAKSGLVEAEQGVAPEHPDNRPVMVREGS